MSILFINKDEVGNLQYWGKTTIAVDSSKVIFFEGFPGAVVVHINGEETASFMVYSTIYPSGDIEAESAIYIPEESSDISADQDFVFSFGTSGVKITNRSTSTDTLEVAWRIRKL